MTWSVHEGDALDVLRGMGAGSVDAVLTDPPYNVGFEYATTADDRPDYAEWCREWFAECRRVCSGAVCIATGHSNLPMWAAIEPWRWLMCWWKPAAMGRCVVGFNNWEPMPLWGKPKVRATCDVVRACIRPDDSLNGHPCPKPLGWGQGFVKALAKPGMTVLDPFAGSGTTGVAAIMAGCNFIGIEIDAGYAEIARRRLAEAESASLFAESAA
jgi:site-specific DNA-methyltransferase (adenine-specific)